MYFLLELTLRAGTKRGNARQFETLFCSLMALDSATCSSHTLFAVVLVSAQARAQADKGCSNLVSYLLAAWYGLYPMGTGLKGQTSERLIPIPRNKC